MWHLNLSRNTAYNPMIYIPFFIVILIDKRGGREAEKRERLKPHNDTHNDIHNDTHGTHTAERERERRKRYDQKEVWPSTTTERKEVSAAAPTTPQDATQRHTRLHSAYTPTPPPTGTHTHTRVHTRTRLHARLHACTHACRHPRGRTGAVWVRDTQA